MGCFYLNGDICCVSCYCGAIPCRWMKAEHELTRKTLGRRTFETTERCLACFRGEDERAQWAPPNPPWGVHHLFNGLSLPPEIQPQQKNWERIKWRINCGGLEPSELTRALRWGWRWGCSALTGCWERHILCCPRSAFRSPPSPPCKAQLYY